VDWTGSYLLQKQKQQCVGEWIKQSSEFHIRWGKPRESSCLLVSAFSGLSSKPPFRREEVREQAAEIELSSRHELRALSSI
jgi:hypothetical protein